MNKDALPILFAQDADPFEGSGLTDLQKHDAKYHPDGYRDGDYCKYRKALERGDDADQLAAAEKEEGDQNAAMQKLIDRYNALGILMMTQPLSEQPYESVFAEYGIKKGGKEFSDAMLAMTDAQEWYENEGVDPADPANTIPLRLKVLDLHDRLSAIASGKPATAAAPKKASPKEMPKESPSASPASQKDYDDLYAVRDVLEPAARLLNGRVGNLSALQSSSRWSLLNKVARDVQFGAPLDVLSALPDKDVAKYAKMLKNVWDNIVKSSKSNWNTSAGKVPLEAELPEPPDL